MSLFLSVPKYICFVDDAFLAFVSLPLKAFTLFLESMRKLVWERVSVPFQRQMNFAHTRPLVVVFLCLGPLFLFVLIWRISVDSLEVK